MTAPRSLSFDELTRLAEAASLRADGQARAAGLLGPKAVTKLRAKPAASPRPAAGQDNEPRPKRRRA